MGVRSDLPPAHNQGRHDLVGIVERAKVHPETLYFPSPTGNCQPALRAVAHHPTGVNVRMTEGRGSREITLRELRFYFKVECGRSVYLNLAIGQPPGEVGHHVPIPPHITDAGTHRTEPIYLCRVARNQCGGITCALG